MSTDKTNELAHETVENGFKKYSNAYSYLSPTVLKQMVKSYAFDVLHDYGKNVQDIDFHAFALRVNDEIEKKLKIHFENPL